MSGKRKPFGSTGARSLSRSVQNCLNSFALTHGICGIENQLSSISKESLKEKIYCLKIINLLNMRENFFHSMISNRMKGCKECCLLRSLKIALLGHVKRGIII